MFDFKGGGLSAPLDTTHNGCIDLVLFEYYYIIYIFHWLLYFQFSFL